MVPVPLPSPRQVYLCYGKHTNLELLELYGFVLEDNPHDRAPLIQKVIRKVVTGVQVAAEACYVHGGGQPSWHLLASLRWEPQFIPQINNY